MYKMEGEVGKTLHLYPGEEEVELEGEVLPGVGVEGEELLEEGPEVMEGQKFPIFCVFLHIHHATVFVWRHSSVIWIAHMSQRGRLFRIGCNPDDLWTPCPNHKTSKK